MTRHERVERSDDLLMSPTGRVEDPETAQARKEIATRRRLVGGATSWLILSAILVGIWAASGGGYFWPAWIIAIGAVAIVLRATGLRDYRRGPIADADVDAHLARRRSRRR